MIYGFGKIVSISNASGIPIGLLMKIFRLLSISYVNSPSGCLDEEPKSVWKQRDLGILCKNCFIEQKCSEIESESNIEIANKFGVPIAGNGSNSISLMNNVKHFHSRSLNLDLYNPDLYIPEKFIWRIDGSFNVMHNFMSNNRGDLSKNTKGSNFISDAIQNLQYSGFNINYINLKNVPISEMRFWQAQADIVIDQLLYGWWGSTTLESLALGVPVICYLSEEFLSNFQVYFPELDIPVINANSTNIERILKDCINNPKKLHAIRIASRIFATEFLNPQKNVAELLEFFDSKSDLSPPWKI